MVGMEARNRMNTIDILEQLSAKAGQDKTLKKKLLDTRTAKDPLKKFAMIAASEGYPLTVMDIAAVGEEFHAAMKRSTNGGGENSPMLDHQNDFYEQFLESIEFT